MPRKDRIHEAVKNALVKDGWTITDDPYRIFYVDADVYADLRVEKTDDAAGDGPLRALVIEIKTFAGVSAIHELEVAVGQYAVYRSLLRAVAPELGLYLAVADTVYRSEFQRDSFQLIVRENQVALLVVDIAKEEIVTWTN